jgi:hypothetical protein
MSLSECHNILGHKCLLDEFMRRLYRFYMIETIGRLPGLIEELQKPFVSDDEGGRCVTAG